MAVSKERAKQAALALANKARQGLNLPPVDHLYAGQPSNSVSCAITNTVIDDDLDVSKYHVKTTEMGIGVYPRLETGRPNYLNPVVRVEHEGGSRAFVTYFDNRWYPDLIDRSGGVGQKQKM